jgi:hypothetical protein
MFDSFHEVAQWREDFYDIVVDWWYEDAPLRAMFDDTVSEVEEMERRCDAGIDFHFITRVRVFYRQHEMANDTLGSCYAADCYPEEEILENRLGGHFDDMLEQTREEADRELVRLNREIARDAALVDTA